MSKLNCEKKVFTHSIFKRFVSTLRTHTGYFDINLLETAADDENLEASKLFDIINAMETEDHVSFTGFFITQLILQFIHRS